MVNEILPLSTANNSWRNASLNEIENIHGPRISEGHSIPRAQGCRPNSVRAGLALKAYLLMNFTAVSLRSIRR